MTNTERKALWRKKNPKKNREARDRENKSRKTKDRQKEYAYRYWQSDAGLNSHYKTKYNFIFTANDYKKLLVKQNNRCAICGSASPGKKGVKRFFLDHSHVTNKVRGLLCIRCNMALGLFEDSEDTLLSALTYLKGANNV